MPDLWLTGIPRVTPTNQAPIRVGQQGRGKRLFTWHTFEAPYTLTATAGARYTNSQHSTPHFCFNPVTGELVQQIPANVGARTLRANAPRQHTNAYGDVHMQIEVVAYARRPWTLDLTPAGAASLVKLMNFLRSWSIPDQWAWGDVSTPAATYAEANRPGYRREPDRSGHAFHSKWWANDHWDPGNIAPPWTIAPAKPAAPEWPTGWVLAAQKMLNALGYTDAKGRPLAEDDDLGPATTHATTQYQRDAGLDPDGKPGGATTKSLEEDMAALDDIKAQLADLKNASSKPTGSIWDERIRFQPGTSLHKTFGDSLRAGALLGYAAQYAYKAAPGYHEELLEEIRKDAAKDADTPS